MSRFRKEQNLAFVAIGIFAVAGLLALIMTAGEDDSLISAERQLAQQERQKPLEIRGPTKTFHVDPSEGTEGIAHALQESVEDALEHPAKSVAITPDDLEREKLKFQQVEFHDQDLYPVQWAINATRHRYNTDKILCAIVGTDSVYLGLDGWRTCKNLANNEAFGIPEQYKAFFFTADARPCSKNPDDVVGVVVTCFPANQVTADRLPIRAPSHRTELMVITVDVLE